MSAFNVGKKVSAAVRILQRNRDASARATHLVVKKYPLITYEKALLGQATGGKFPSVTFLERKKMSTKTSFKRIALVAALALTLGGFSAVSANAAVVSAVVVSSANTNTYTDTTTPIAAGTALTFDLKITTTGDMASTDTGTSTYTVTAGANAKDITSTCTFAAATIANLTNAVSTASTGTFTYTATGAVTGATITLGTASCPTTIGGTYNVTSAGTFLKLGVTAVTPTATAPTTKATGSVAVSGGNVTVGTTKNTTTGAAAVGGSATVNFVLPTHASGDVFNILPAAGSAGSIQNVTDAVGTITRYNGSTADYSAGAVDTTASTALHTAVVTASSSVAGTQTINLVSISSTTGVATTVSTVTITWGSVAGLSVGYSAAVSFIADGNVVATSALQTASALSYSKTASGTVKASLEINVRDSANVALLGVPLTVTITGPGLISLASGQTGGAVAVGTVRAASLTATNQAATSVATVGITPDGVAGAATITVASGTTTLFTKTVSFYGTVATLTATQNLSVASTSGATLGTATAAPAGTSIATTPAVTIVAKDSNGVVVTGLTITAKSTDSAVIASGSVIESSGLGAGDGYAGAGSYNASVTSAAGSTSGATTTVVFRTLLSDGVTYISTAPVTFTLGGKASTATYSAALDKSSYAPGEAASLVLTAKDSAGNPIFDQDVTLFAGLGTAPLWSKSVVGITPSSGAISFKSGKKTITGYAPALEGDFKMTSALDPLVVTAGGAVTASSTVTGGEASATSSLALDAANAATDAANNAYDEAQNATQAASDALAAVTALSAQVSALIATVKSLAAMVAKIKAKVKA